MDRLAPALAAAGGGAGGAVLGMADYGPEILYRTPHAVLSILNHRPQPGFAATLRILTATDPAAARAELERAGVDWILLCPNPVEREVFAAGAASGTTFYRRLIDGEAPAWLRPLPLPEDVAAAVRLFAVAPTGEPTVAGQPAPDAPRVEHGHGG